MFSGIVVSLFFMYFSKTMYIHSLSSLTIIIGLLFGFTLMIGNYFMLVGFQNFDLNLGTIVLSSELVFASIFAYLL